MTNLVKLPALSSIDKRLMFLQQSEKRALSKPTASVPVILGGPLEGQPFNVPNFSIDLGRTGRTLDYFENQMQRTSPQTIIDPSERRSQRLQTTQQSRSLEKAEDAMIDERHRGIDSDGSSMPLYSAVNDDTFFKQLDKSSGSPNGQKSEGVGEKVAPPQGDYFVIDRGSLPFQHISFYVRSRQIPISRLPLSYTHGYGRNKLSYQSLFKYPSTHHLQNGVSGTVSNEMPLTENSYLRKPLSQSRTEWPVQTTSTPAREQDIHPGQVNRLVNDIRYESGKHSLGEAVPIIADGSIDQVSHFELPDANLPSKNHEVV
uniref:Uncharacterized protein n=1 Tax=Parascaris equorum TaxID=6256 RepID=A0A914SFK4_PAREQ